MNQRYPNHIVSLAKEIHALTYPTPMLVPHTVDELVAALKIDYDDGGFFDIGTFCCGICLANGTTYKPWSDEAYKWIADNTFELSLAEFVGPDDSFVNHCPGCAENIGAQLWQHTDTRRAVPPPDIFA